MNIPMGVQVDFRQVRVLSNGDPGDVHLCVNGHPIGIRCVGKGFIEHHESGWRRVGPEKFNYPRNRGNGGLACSWCWDAVGRLAE